MRRALILTTVLVGALGAGGTALAEGTSVGPAGTTTTTTVAVDPLFPITTGSNGPAVAAVQGRLGITVDCDFGNQTGQAVKDWQTSRGDSVVDDTVVTTTTLPVDGSIDADDWALLAIPATWGTDTNANGTIDPSEITLVCDGTVELPADPNAPTTTVSSDDADHVFALAFDADPKIVEDMATATDLMDQVNQAMSDLDLLGVLDGSTDLSDQFTLLVEDVTGLPGVEGPFGQQVILTFTQCSEAWGGLWDSFGSDLDTSIAELALGTCDGNLRRITDRADELS